MDSDPESLDDSAQNVIETTENDLNSLAIPLDPVPVAYEEQPPASIAFTPDWPGAQDSKALAQVPPDPTLIVNPELNISPVPDHRVVVTVPAPRFLPLPYATSRSGLVYDARMRYHADIFPTDDEDPHPEVPQRITWIYNELIDAGLAPNPAYPQSDSDDQLVRILIRQATTAEICLVHTPEHVHWVQSLANAPTEELLQITAQLSRARSIYVHNLTWLCASLAAGGAIEAAKAVVGGFVRNSIALIRPPGHHAEHGHAEGFCFFNNVCIAARVVQAEHPDLCRKILILDWDVHHGNGIQREFYSDPNVLYVSIHVHENGTFYPQGEYGNHLHCGDGQGLGRNVNVPWSKVHMGDAEYIYAFQQVIMPIAVEFDPDLVFISAGFDAADGDPLGACHVSPACYGHMTHMLMQLAKGKVVACLEGGYNLQSISKCALSMTRVLMGEPPDRMAELHPTARGVDDIHRVIRTQAKFWKCMYPKHRELNLKLSLGSERLHDIIREWQGGKFWKEHQMLPLFILRDKLSKSFENQVLATQNYSEARPLLVIFHDPPEAKGFPNPRTNDLELHNTWLTDFSKRYVEWAIEQDFAVIDVNIPKHITREADQHEYEDSDAEDQRARSTQELAHYLWQNYIETGDSTHVIFMGIGDAYVGIIRLISEHASAATQIDLSIAFVANNYLRAINRPGDENAVGRFYRRSLVYVAYDHLAFSGERRLKRKHGRVFQSPENELQEMMAAHFDQVTEHMLAITEGWREAADYDDEVMQQDPEEQRMSVEISKPIDGGPPSLVVEAVPTEVVGTNGSIGQSL